MYARKTKTVYCIELDFGHGYIPVYETDSKVAAKILKDEYIQNGTFANRIRVKKRRIKIINGETYYV